MKTLTIALQKCFDIDTPPILYDSDTRCWTPIFRIEVGETLKQIIADTNLKEHIRRSPEQTTSEPSQD